MTPMFSGGRNIAMKVPPHQWETTVAFYRDVLGRSRSRPTTRPPRPERLAEADVVRCDAIEPIDADSPLFWISSPAQVVHLVGPDRAGG